MILDFIINNQLSKPPVEYRGIEVELNFEGETVQTTLLNQQFTFVNENADLINNWINSNLGIFNGIPLKINAHNQTFFDGMIDLTKDLQVSCSEVKANLLERKQKDWLNEVADKFDFSYLFDKNVGIKTITEADFIKIPYVVSEIPDYKAAATLSITFFLVTIEIRRIIKDLTQNGFEMASIIDAAGGIVGFILNIAFLVVLIAAIIKLLEDVLNELIQPIRYHYGMSVLKHFEKGCEYLGLTFSSSIFQKNIPSNSELTSGYFENLVIIPEKNEQGGSINNLRQQGYYNGTFGDFIRDMASVFNAKITLIGNTLHFERKDYTSSISEYKIPDVKIDFTGYNTEDLKANYLIQFAVDSLDLNTINRYDGTNARIVTSSITKGADGTELIKGLEEKQFRFALGRRKNDFTRVEKLVRTFLRVTFQPIITSVYAIAKSGILVVRGAVRGVNRLISVINAVGGNLKKIPVPPINLETRSAAFVIDKRLGVLSLSSDFIGVPKLVLITGSGNNVTVAADNETKLSAVNLWNKYHYIESFVPSANKPNGNQYLIKTAENVPFCIEDYKKIRGLNNEKDGEARIVSPQGRPSKIRSIKWNLWQDVATIEYLENFLYAKNLKQDVLINTGK